MDRRIERTQKAIFNALLELMNEKEFDKISINEIAQRANVNRGTIYSHYTDKNDLLKKYIASCIAPFQQECSVESPEVLMLGTFEYIEENVDVFKTLLMNGGATSFKETLQEMVFSGLTKANRNQNTEDSIPQEIKYHFVASAMTGTIEWWVKSPTRYKPAIMVEHILHLLNKLQ